MILRQLLEHRIINRLNGARHKQASCLAQRRQMFAMLQQMLDLDCPVIRNARKLPMKCLNNRQRMPHAVEKIGIAKSDMRRARRHLPANIFKHNLAWNNPKHTVVHRNNRTMTAKMLAPAASLRITSK